MTKSTAPASSSTTSTRKPLASKDLVVHETELGHLIASSSLAKRLVDESIHFQAERRDCEVSYTAVKEAMGNWGPRLGFVKRMLEVIPEAIRLSEAQGVTRFGKVVIVWQAIVGIVDLYEVDLHTIFGIEENRIASILNRTPVTKGHAEDDFVHARPTPKPAKAPRPQAPDIDALLRGGDDKGKTRGERGGNRGHGPKTTANAPAPADIDDDRQPPGLNSEASSLFGRDGKLRTA